MPLSSAKSGLEADLKKAFADGSANNAEGYVATAIATAIHKYTSQAVVELTTCTTTVSGASVSGGPVTGSGTLIKGIGKLT